MEKIYVTKSFLPSIEEYMPYLLQIWNTSVLTNGGALSKELEEKLKIYLDVSNLHFIANGTLALQLALDSLGIKDGDIITTPFSYVATTSSILWERCNPIFVDIDKNTLCIDAEKIEEKITKNTKAIMAVHVFGNACDTDKIENIATKYGLKVIYDGAHAFGSKYKGKSLMDYGDISICSFHATKLFHTVEGGICVAKDKSTSDRIDLAKRFGHDGEEYYQLGINAKNSEFHAAMGLCNLKHIDKIIAERKKASDLYDRLFDEKLNRPILKTDIEYNYSYYPVIFESESQLLNVFSKLNAENIYPRRYFFPSLNTLPYLDNKQSCPISEDISKRIACLPFYVGLEKKTIEKIVNIILENLNQ